MFAVTIRSLDIQRFRGVRGLSWRPNARLNIILGAADVCKSTVLEAIALLFSSASNFSLSEHDYHNRDVDAGFSIEAVLAVGDGAFLRDEGFPAPPLQGWLNGKLHDLPDEDGAEAVLVCRLTGTGDQEARYEIIGAGGELRAPFSRALRRRLGMARLGVADRGDRDIRLVQGGALDRYLQGREVRQTVMKTVMKTGLHDELDDGPKSALKAIGDSFQKRNLPHPVRLGLVGAPGVSLAASVGLTIGASDPVALPLTSWGTGTRRLAALEISTLGVGGNTIAVIDEPEAGLEPYRQRVFIRDLAAANGQAFITTHSPAVLAQAQKETSTTWRMGASKPTPLENELRREGEPPAREPDFHVLVAVSGSEIATVAMGQPEALFAKLPVVCEGITEVGFATRLFEHRFGPGYSCRGLFCLDAGGHYRALPACKDFISSGYALAAVVDDEGKKSGDWAKIGAKATLLRWHNGACLEKAVISELPDTMLQEVHIWAELVSHRSARHQLADLRSALQVDPEKRLNAVEIFEEVGRERFINALIGRACPKPEGNSKPRGWFKSFDGGYLLADKLLSLVPPPPIMGVIDAFLCAVDIETVP